MKSIDLFPFTGEPGGYPAEFVLRQAEAPLAEVELPSGDRARLVVRRDDVAEVLVNRAFSRDLGYEGAPRVSTTFDSGSLPGAIIGMDPPEHTRLRRLVAHAFTPRLVERWRPRIVEICAELLDGLKEPPADLVQDYALPIPVRVICAMLGVPHADIDRFQDWSIALVSVSAHTMQERLDALQEFQEYAHAMIDRHRRDPGEGLLDELVRARDHGEKLTEEELVLTTLILIVAGYEAVAIALSRGVLTLLKRGQYAALVEDPARVPGAVEEILRFDPPGPTAFLRVAKQDVELPSGTVRAGEAVLAVTSAANRDPRHIGDPHEFDIGRADSDHLSFGAGPHFCIGAYLARTELHAALLALCTRLPGLRLAVPPEEIAWSSGMMLQGPEVLPVVW